MKQSLPFPRVTSGERAPLRQASRPSMTTLDNPLLIPADGEMGAPSA